VSEAPIITGRLRLKDETGGTLDSFKASFTSTFKDAGKVAAGMLMRDMVNSMTAAFGESVRLGGSVETLRRGFQALKGDIGDEVLSLETLRRSTRGTVSEVELLKAANNALSLGLPTEDLNALFEAAMVVGHAMGRDTLQSVQDLTTGIGRQSRLILDNLGIILDTKAAHEAYAEALGKSASELTDAEKKTAFMTAAIEALNAKAEQLSGTTSQAQIKQEQFAAAIDDTKTKVGEALTPLGQLGPVLARAMPAFGTFAGTLLPGLIGKLAGAGGLTGAFSSLGGSVTSIAGMIGLTGPLGLAILGIGAAVGVFALAWKNNWFGIRDSTKAAIDAIGGAFKGLQDWLGGLGRAWKNFWEGASRDAEKGADEITRANERIEFGASPGGLRDVVAAVEDLGDAWNRTVSGLSPVRGLGILGHHTPTAGPSLSAGPGSVTLVFEEGAIQFIQPRLDSAMDRRALVRELVEEIGKEFVMRR